MLNLLKLSAKFLIKYFAPALKSNFFFWQDAKIEKQALPKCDTTNWFFFWKS